MHRKTLLKYRFITIAAGATLLVTGSVHAQLNAPGPNTPQTTAEAQNIGPGTPNVPPSAEGPNVPADTTQPATTPDQPVTPAPQPAPAVEQPAIPGPQPGPGQPAMPEPGQPAAPAPGQPAAQPAPGQKAAPPPPPQQRPITTGGGSSFFFDDADVFEVIQTVFGDVLRVNYIIDPQVKGRVNFRTVTPIPRDKILPIMEIILRLNGVAIVEESGLYRIIPMGGIAKEPAHIRFGKDPNSVELKGTAVIQIVQLTFINSAEMMAILNPLLTQGGAIYDVPKRNILIIADTDANVRRLLQVVTLFDENTYKDASQPKIYVYPLQNSKAEHVAKILQQVLLGTSGTSSSTSTTTRSVTGTSSTVGTTTRPATTPSPQQPSPMQSLQQQGEPVVSPGTKVIADDVTNSLVIFASPGDYSLIMAAIKQIDTIPRQVMIEAIVARLDLTDNLSFGVRWNLETDIKVSLDPFKNPISLGGTLGHAALGTAGTFGFLGRDSKGQARLVIKTLTDDKNGKILSAPHILVADNREARIQVGQQIPIATSTTSTPFSGTTPTNTTTSTVQYKDTGTILKVKPQINDSGLVALEITQEVSTTGDGPQDVLGTQQFVITKSEVTTNLIVQDGETIVLGGLINETRDDNTDGIPFLHKIPVLGALFGSVEHKVARTELVVLITPRVVRNQVEANQMTADYLELFKNLRKEIKHERLQNPGTGKKEQPQQPAVPEPATLKK